MSENNTSIKIRDERVAAEVRRALGEFDDYRQPVVYCVKNLVTRTHVLTEKVAELQEELCRYQQAPVLDSSDGEYNA